MSDQPLINSYSVDSSVDFEIAVLNLEARPEPGTAMVPRNGGYMNQHVSYRVRKQSLERVLRLVLLILKILRQFVNFFC